MPMKLSQLFRRCVERRYIHVENAGDYATDRIGDVLYIYLQCSDGVTDWKNNLDFPAKAYTQGDAPHLFVHRGFLRVWESVKPHAVSLIADARTKSITCVGYSHGAALALLCYDFACRIRPQLAPRTEGYGFGSPRVLWGMRTPAVQERFARFTVIRNLDDIVTHLPPAALGYFHAGNLLEIGEKENYSGIDSSARS